MSHPFADESLPELMLGLKSPNPAVRAKSARGLAKMGPTGKEVFQALFALTDDPEQAVREAAVQGLGAFGAHAVPVLIRLLGHSCKYVRRNVVWALGKKGSDAVPAIRPLCNARATDSRVVLPAAAHCSRCSTRLLGSGNPSATGEGT